MSATSMAKSTRDTSPRMAALIAGTSLLAMAVIAGLSNFGIINNLVVPGDPQATAANLIDSAMLFRLGAVGMIVVSILDVVVAWGLYIVLRSVNPSLSLLAAWFRLVYAAIFAIAVNSLFSALRAAPTDPAQADFHLESFQFGWQIGLVMFGLSLGLVGLLVWRSGYIHWLFGALLMLSGLGYLVDGFGKLLLPNYSLDLATYTFIGEVAFIFWLLIRGRKLPDAVVGNIGP